MNTIAEKLKTTYLGLAGLTTSMRQLLSVGAKEVTSQEINSKLDGVAQESTVEEGVNTLSNKIDNIQLPEIDTTELAKQGENQEATNSAIYNAIGDTAAALTTIDEILGEL